MFNRLNFFGPAAAVRWIFGVSLLMGIVLLIIRFYWSASIGYFFLIWNLFLAWIPLLFSHRLVRKRATRIASWKVVVLLGLWLLFFPNAPYILTDLFHLPNSPNVPMWFDLVLILNFAWNGLIAGFVSLMEVQQFLRKRLSERISWLAVAASFLLSGFGVYLGRYERWNSWDILTHPFGLAESVLRPFLHPFGAIDSICISLLFAVFLGMTYLTLVVLIKALKNE